MAESVEGGGEDAAPDLGGHARAEGHDRDAEHGALEQDAGEALKGGRQGDVVEGCLEIDGDHPRTAARQGRDGGEVFVGDGRRVEDGGIQLLEIDHEASFAFAAHDKPRVSE